MLRTFSKIYGLAGLRLGYVLASPALVPYLNAVQEPFNMNRRRAAEALVAVREELSPAPDRAR